MELKFKGNESIHDGRFTFEDKENKGLFDAACDFLDLQTVPFLELGPGVVAIWNKDHFEIFFIRSLWALKQEVNAVTEKKIFPNDLDPEAGVLRSKKFKQQKHLIPIIKRLLSLTEEGKERLKEIEENKKEGGNK